MRSAAGAGVWLGLAVAAVPRVECPPRAGRRGDAHSVLTGLARRVRTRSRAMTADLGRLPVAAGYCPQIPGEF